MQGQAAASASATTANAGQTQKELLMQHEMFMKPRVAGLTNLERRTLELWMSSQKDAYNELKNKIQTEGGQVEKLERDKEKHDKFIKRMAKIISRFGYGHGTLSATQNLLSHFAGAKHWPMGQMVPPDSVEWVLCKHFFLTARCPERPDPSQVVDYIECHCLPKTAFFLSGCMHNKLNLFSPQVGQMYQHSLCPAFSTCVRCDKYLG